MTATAEPIAHRMDRLPRALLTMLLALAALALCLGPLQFGDERDHPLPALEGEPGLAPGPFQEEAIPPHTGHQQPWEIAVRASWIGSEKFTGEHRTGWYRPRRDKITVLIAGYPAGIGNRLELEVQHRDGTITSVPYLGRNPLMPWDPWFVTLPRDTAAVRIHAVDGSVGPEGWLGFSEPFEIRYPLDWQALAWLQLLTTTCLAVVLLYGPGLLWVRRRGAQNGATFATALLAGPLVLAALGLVCWIGGGFIAPAWIARIGTTATLIFLAANRHKIVAALRECPTGATRILAAGALLVGFGVAKANISIGAPGELYGGLVSRTLEVGGHSDSRISYHVVQLIANHEGPFSAQANSLFSPWTFASRGPLAGLIAAPLVLATGAHVTSDLPNQSWRPFDRHGFATYRIALIALASLAAWSVYGAVSGLAGSACGLLAAIAAMLAPFFVHEMYFTWPKLITAGLVLSAFLLAEQRRAFASGVTLALGYLFHPLAILSGPFIAIWLTLRHRPAADNRLGLRLRHVAAFCAGAGLLVGAWQLVAWCGPNGGGQAGFVTYFHMADNAPATVLTWWQTRWQNFANTFIPFHLLGFTPTHESINAVGGLSPWWVRAGFLYWNTLPFALGFPLFGVTIAGCIYACRRFPAVAVITLIAPALFLVAYWGAADSGLMRHCGHVLFLTTIVLAIWALHRAPEQWQRGTFRYLLHPACFAWRAGEVLLMAFATTLANGFPHPNGPFVVNDCVSLGAATACLFFATISLAGAARHLHGQSAALK